MKKVPALRMALLCLSIIVTPTTQAQTYCTPAPGVFGCQDDHSIHNFSVSGENATSIQDMNVDCVPNAYADHTSLSMDVTIGNQYLADIMGNFYPQQGSGEDNLAVWIDFSDDGIFSADELMGVALDVAGGYDNLFNISIPNWVSAGPHRMRLALAYDGSPSSMDPCNTPGGINTWQYGEVVDYTVNVLPSCALPSAPVINNITQTTANVSWAGLPGITYEYVTDQLASDPAGAGTPTAAYSYTATSLSANTDYYAHIRANCGAAYSAWETLPFTTLPVPTCDAVTNTLIYTLTSTEAVINWDAVTGAANYECTVDQLATDPTGPGTPAIYLSYDAYPLTPGTNYYAHVRTACTNGAFSTWVNYPFTTLGGVWTGVNNVSGPLFNVSVFPNPVKDVLSVQLQGQAADNGKITLCDITGKQVKQLTVKARNINFDVHGLAPGLYLLKYTDDVHVQMLRVNKQ